MTTTSGYRMTSEKIEKRIKLANFLGIKMQHHQIPGKWIFYDGATIHFGKTCPTIKIDHEIGHWFAADEEQRGIPEWGLGAGFNQPSKNIIAKISVDRWRENLTATPETGKQGKETMAAIYGVAIAELMNDKTTYYGQKDIESWRAQAAESGYEAAFSAENVKDLIMKNEIKESFYVDKESFYVDDVIDFIGSIKIFKHEE
jgi:hypothetical protein